MRLTSPAYAEGGRIPDLFTCIGDNLSPPLAWSDIPPGTKSLALFCEDPDAPAGIWHHWAIFDLLPTSTGLPQGVAPGDHPQARNDFQQVGYGGPCPPPGHGLHRYQFRLLALDVSSLRLPTGCAFSKARQSASQHRVGEALLTGTFSR
jgi:Raf kinase inhibitor-like YbhB/YbcL family protein